METERLELSYTAGGKIKYYSHCRKHFDVSSVGLNMELSQEPAISLLGIYWKELKTVHTKTRTWMFKIALFVIVKEWKQSKLMNAAAAKSLQSCLTLCDPIDGSPPGSCVHGILQARVLEWVAISFSNALKWKVKVKSLSRVRLLATPQTAPYQAPASMGFSRQEYWSGLPLPSPIDE